ncbi:unnamed protein product [Peronospora belbahrii]|uniref:pectinesterase n=1 Tax=Peronospora belbahrii TaxID=622444 RepID=A0AAU9L629_9STRA|nr:unnamed protein product [Peronospora belbahrii]
MSYAENTVTNTQTMAQKDLAPEIKNQRNFLTSTLRLKSPSGVKIYNINVANPTGKIDELGQAIAVYVDATDHAFYRCQVIGYLDTAKAWIESCDIESTGDGWITANGNTNSSNLSHELSDVVNPAGWDTWEESTNTSSIFSKEYCNSGLGADTSMRAKFSGLLSGPVDITEILGQDYKSKWWFDSTFL